MMIAKNPKRHGTATTDEQAQALNPKGEPPVELPAEEQNKKPIMIRVAPMMLERIDRAARRLGISRSAFIVSSTAIRLENME
jgi:hypothetical protein